jgi:hypothetical protein
MNTVTQAVKDNAVNTTAVESKEEVTLQYGDESWMPALAELKERDIYDVLPNGDHLTFSVDEETGKVFYKLDKAEHPLNQPAVTDAITEEDVKIMGVRLSKLDKKIIGYADVECKGNRYRNLRCVMSTNNPGTYFVRTPNRADMYQGKKTWFPMFRIEANMFKVIEQAVIKAVTSAQTAAPKAATPAPQNNMPAPQKPGDPLDIALEAIDISKILHSSATKIKDVEVQKYPRSGIRYVVINNLKYLQQNPAKTDSKGNLSEWAKKAQEGHLITWIVDLNKPEGKQYIGVVIDGKYEPR